jgi:hypothetical protein
MALPSWRIVRRNRLTSEAISRFILLELCPSQTLKFLQLLRTVVIPVIARYEERPGHGIG